MQQRKKRVTRDLLLILLSIVTAVLLVQTEGAERFITLFDGIRHLDTVIAGMFFTSIFTTAPAIALLGELAQQQSIYTVAFFGAIGAVAGDYLLFRFVRDRFSEDVKFLLRRSTWVRIPAVFETKLFHRILPFLGALIIASPLPDELGLALLGLSNVSDRAFFPISFAFNFLGILLIGWVATSVVW